MNKAAVDEFRRAVTEDDDIYFNIGQSAFTVACWYVPERKDIFSLNADEFRIFCLLVACTIESDLNNK